MSEYEVNLNIEPKNNYKKAKLSFEKLTTQEKEKLFSEVIGVEAMQFLLNFLGR